MSKNQKKPVKKIKNVSVSKSPSRKPSPSLRFTPTAWAKLLFLRDYEDTEVGGFGITATDDLLLIEDIQLVKQVCSWAHVAFDDTSVADLFDEQVDAGRQPEQFARIWIHTHPGDCPQPSLTDEETFDRVFGRSDWAVMFILASGGQSYARLRYNVGPRSDSEIPVEVDYSRTFGGCYFDAWEQEYLANVAPDPSMLPSSPTFGSATELSFEDDPNSEWNNGWFDYVEDQETVKGFLT